MQDGRKVSSTNPPKRKKAVQHPQKSRISDYLFGKPKPIKAEMVDLVKEKKQRLTWFMKWVVILPLSALVLMWLVVIFIDLFKY
jgi:hypothetical protein